MCAMRRESVKSAGIYHEEVLETSYQKWIRSQLEKRVLEYSDIHHVPIFTGSWNVNSKVLPDASSLRDWLLPKNSQPSDIYAIGFQETVDLNMVNVVVTSRASDEMATYWIGKVKETLFETGNKYVLLVERHLVGLLFLVMVKQQLFEKVNDVRVAIQATGVLGVLGNKGGISIRLKLYDSLICFVCAHFHASRESVETRNLDYQTILEASNLAPVTTPGLNVNKSQYVTYKVTEDPHDTEETNSKIIDHEHIFWIGDLNYRIVEDVSLAEIFERISKGEWDVLRLKDQLLIEKTRNNIFSGFEEGILNFPPTYKYQPGTDLYEARPDRKLRAPAWCDRILWKTTRNKEAVKLIKYTTAPLNVSDHKPVYALFNCEVRQVVGTRMKGLYQELLFSVDKWINASNPKLSIEGRFIDFGMMSCEQKYKSTMEIKNVGTVMTEWALVPKNDEEHICQPWLSFSPTEGILAPEETMSIVVTADLDVETAVNYLSTNMFKLEDIVVLRVISGNDFFCMVNAVIDQKAVQESFERMSKIADTKNEQDDDMVEVEYLESIGNSDGMSFAGEDKRVLVKGKSFNGVVLERIQNHLSKSGEVGMLRATTVDEDEDVSMDQIYGEYTG